MSDACNSHPWAFVLPEERGGCEGQDLAALESLEDFYATSRPLERLDLNALDTALESNSRDPANPPGIWERLLRWLRELFGDSELGLPDWLRELSVDQGALDWIVYATLGLIVIAALLIIANELREIRRARRPQTEPRWTSGAVKSPGTLTLEDAARVPLKEIPGLVLRMVLDRLQDTGLVSRRPSMTHREIADVANQLQDGVEIAAVAQAAERSTFAGWQPTEDEVRVLLDTARQLLRRLERQR